jgi:hypothetical protein
MQHPDYPLLLRKVLYLGKSTAITLPPKWTRTHVHPTHPYATIEHHTDGSLVIRAFAPPPAQPPNPPRPDHRYLDPPPH